MFTSLITFVQESIGIHTCTMLQIVHMITRGIIIYFCGLTVARFNKKFLGIRTTFNFILFIMLGSIFANAILDAKVFLATLSTIFILLLLNALMTALSYYFLPIEYFIKGQRTILVKNGIIQQDAMRKNFITERELLNALHAQLHKYNFKGSETAIITSDGKIVFVEETNNVEAMK